MPDKTTTKNIGEDSATKLDRFKLDISKDADNLSEQRDKANEDMRFINVDGAMWADFQEDSFFDRVKLEFDIVSNFINRFLGEWNQNRVGVEYKPDDSKTSDEDAELLNGIYRADFRQFSGRMAVDNAVDEAVTCGYGCFKLGTFFEDKEDPENDLQRIEWRPIANAFNSVFWDNSAERIDKRDARHCTVLKQYTSDSFEVEFPGHEPSSAYVPDTRRFQNLNSSNLQAIYVATRYEVVKKKESLFIYNNLITGEVETYNKEDHKLIEDELKGSEFHQFVRERTIIRQHVEKSVFSGEEFLEKPKRIAGKWIPIIAVYGYRAYTDGVEWYRGLVRKLKDAARLFNMQLSQLAENSASSGQEVPIFDPDQIEGLEGVWADRNNKPYMLARALRDGDGKIIQHGPTSYLKPQQLDSSTAALMQIVPEFIQGVTGGALQDTLDPKASGKAIQAMRKREDLNTQVINDNISNAIEWSGEVYQSMAAEVYTTSRIVRTIGKDGTDGQQQLLKTVFDEETGRLIESNTLRGKKFRVFADVGPQYETLREQTVEDLKGMLDSIAKIPSGEQYIPAIMATLLDNISGVGLGPLKDLNRQNMLLQGLVKPETDEEKEFLAKAQQPQGQDETQRKLIEAATQQQLSEARNLDAASAEKIKGAELKAAQTMETLAGIEMDQAKTASDIRVNEVKTLQEIRKEIFQPLTSIPV